MCAYKLFPPCAFVLLYVVLGVVPATHAARILVFIPTPSKSHTIIHSAVADALARAAHNVTVIGVSNNVYPKATYKYIQIELEQGGSFDKSKLKRMVNKPQPHVRALHNLLRSFINTTNQTLNHPRMREFLSQNGVGAFHLVLLGYALNDNIVGLGAHFRCPIVLSFMIKPHFMIHRLVGNPMVHSHIPTLTSDLKEPLTFGKRVVNYVSNFVEQSILLPIYEREWLKVYK